MVHFFLLLLLPPVVLADQEADTGDSGEEEVAAVHVEETVCFNISNGEVKMNSTNITVSDGRGDARTCELNPFHCLFHCIPKTDSQWFNGSSGCLEADSVVKPTMETLIFKDGPNCTAYRCMADAITQLMNSLTSGGTLLREMEELFYVRNSCADLFNKELLVKESYLK